MTAKRQTTYLVLTVLILSLAALACGTGSQTTSKITGNSGEVRVRINETSGVNTTSVELNEDWFREQLAASVTFSLETGSCRASVIGEDGTQITVDAAAGSPGQASGQLITDGFGEVDLETNCQGSAQNLDVTIAFNR